MSDTAPVAVLDTSVLVPAWSRLILQRLAAAPLRPFVPVWSEWIVAETWRVLTWQWVERAGNLDGVDVRRLTRAANGMLSRMLDVMTFVTLQGQASPPPWPELRDADDAPIWQTAVLAGAHYVVSHNLSDFPPLMNGRHAFAGIEYLTTAEFVEDVLGEDAAVIYGGTLPAGAMRRSRRVR